ncbi:hypothetical protein AKI53_02070 [Streptococcus pneumoniae]|nr:hypothetical protein AKI53_02070 [Streptococcus pneumoniae]
MLYVGIDVAKNKHDVTALNVPGKTVLKPLTFSRYPNPQKRIEAGFDKLIEIKRLTASNSRAFCRALKSSPNHQIEIRNSLDKTIDFSYSLSFS